MVSVLRSGRIKKQRKRVGWSRVEQIQLLPWPLTLGFFEPASSVSSSSLEKETFFATLDLELDPRLAA